MPASGRRLFFSLWPPAEVQESFAEQARACELRGRPVPPERLHLTLAFLGRVDESCVEALLAGARGIAVPGFELELGRIGYFPRAAAVWLGPLRIPAALADLAQAVQICAADAGIDLQAHRFRPHVTLARRAERPRRRRVARPMVWPVRDFGLTESVDIGGQAVYRDLERWPLRRV